jgi:hypothetical protein
MAAQQNRLQLSTLVHRRRKLAKSGLVYRPPWLLWVRLHGIDRRLKAMPEAAVRNQRARLGFDGCCHRAEDR